MDGMGGAKTKRSRKTSFYKYPPLTEFPSQIPLFPLHQLRHGQEQKLMHELAGLKTPAGQWSTLIANEKAYFAGEAKRMNYKEIAESRLAHRQRSS